MSQFNNMSVKERKSWLQSVDETHGRSGNFSGYFNNIQGILRFADEEGLMKPGSWESWTDAGILGGIQDGLAQRLGKTAGAQSQNPGTANWSAFFSYRASSTGVTDEGSRHLWGIAEQSATDYGTAYAGARGAKPDKDVERTLITWGNKYRAAMADPELRHTYARNAGTKIGSFVGGPALGAVGFAAGWLAGPPISDWAIDPRQEFVAHDLSAGIYHGGAASDIALGWLIGG